MPATPDGKNWIRGKGDAAWLLLNELSGDRGAGLELPDWSAKEDSSLKVDRALAIRLSEECFARFPESPTLSGGAGQTKSRRVLAVTPYDAAVA